MKGTARRIHTSQLKGRSHVPHCYPRLDRSRAASRPAAAASRQEAARRRVNTLTNYVNETVKTEIDFPAVTTNPLRKAA